MIWLVLILAAALVAVGIFFYRDFKKGAQAGPTITAAPYKVEPSTVVVSGGGTNPSFPGQDLATKLGYYNPNRVVVDAKPMERQTALIGNGGPVEHKTGHGFYSMPDVNAGQSIELEISRGYEPISVSIVDYRGVPIVDSVDRVWSDYVLETGAGNIRFVAPVAGNYTVELTGGGGLTTLNHWRR